MVSAAALRSTTVGSEPTSTGRCEPVGTEQMSTGHLVVFASLRSVQSGHPPDVLHPCIFPYQSFKLPMKGTELDYGKYKGADERPELRFSNINDLASCRDKSSIDL